MTKKILSIFILIFLFIPQPTYADLIPTQNIVPSPIPSPSQVDYPLPYPGILPDRPFFFVKDIRDKILELTTINPYKKTEFYLMQADKKLSSARVLFDSGDIKCSEKTISTSLDYLEKTINEEGRAKNTPGNIMELSQKILQSSKKQTEVIESFYKHSSEEYRSKFEEDLIRVKNLRKIAEEFRP